MAAMATTISSLGSIASAVGGIGAANSQSRYQQQQANLQEQQQALSYETKKKQLKQQEKEAKARARARLAASGGGSGSGSGAAILHGLSARTASQQDTLYQDYLLKRQSRDLLRDYNLSQTSASPSSLSSLFSAAGQFNRYF